MILNDLMMAFNGQIVSEKRQETFEKIRIPLKPVVTLEQLEKDKENSDSAIIKDIKIEDGIVKVYYHGLQEPFLGLPDGIIVQIVSIYKRLFILLIASMARQNIFNRIITALAIINNKGIWADWFELIFKTYPIRLKEQYYLPCVKEIRRVLKGKLPTNILDAITAIIENDNAYRYRLQDILVLLDKSKLNGFINTKKELERLIDILIDRDEKQVEQRKKYPIFKKLLFILIIPKIRKVVIDILKDIDLDKIKMTKEEIYFSNRYMVYKCRGLDWDTRKQENINKYGAK